MKKILAADLFCGAGGASTGLLRACDEVGLDLDLLAINHWTTAVKTHALNHPGVRHLCESLERVDPREQIPGGRLHVLLAGPECTHFSTARGGRPVNPQSRASAWHIAKWAQELYIDTILIENVPEFRTWGPIGADSKPLKSKKGETFKAFLKVLESLGYRVDVKILNAADYGDPTTRQRLFIMARRGKHAIRWPEPTHSKSGDATLFGGRKRWTPARQVIDWNIKGKSIFHRKKPLRPATMARIIAGLRKFGGPDLQPFLVLMEHGGRVGSVDNPLPTITTAKGGAIGVAEPFLLHTTHGGRVNDIDRPFPTVTGARRGELAAIEAFVMSAGGPDCPARPVSEPLGTVLTRDHRAVVETFVLPQHGGGALRPTGEPLPTIATDGAIGVVEPFIARVGFANGHDDSGAGSGAPRRAEGGAGWDGLATQSRQEQRAPGADCTDQGREQHPGQVSVREVQSPQPAAQHTGAPSDLGGAERTDSCQVGSQSPRRREDEQFSVESRTGDPRAESRARVSDRSESGDAIPGQGATTVGREEGRDHAAALGWSQLQPDRAAGGSVADQRIPNCTDGSFLAKYFKSGEGVVPTSQPVPTVTTRDRFALVEPFIANYYGQKDGEPRVTSIEAPIPTIPTNNRFALVQPVINGLALDIHFRMLQPHELAAAMSFPKTYKFTGTREEVVKQIGNSWAGELSKALCVAAVQDFAPKKKMPAWRDEATA